MSAEPTRNGQLRKRQFTELRQYLADEVHPYVPVLRQALDEAGIDHGRIAGFDEFARLPLVAFVDLGTGADHLMEPTPQAVRSAGPFGMRAKAQFARFTGRSAAFEFEVIGPRYKPLVWTVDRRLRSGWSARDLAHLGDLGRRMLERAGVRGGDRLLTVGLEPHQTAFWQFSLGARVGGVSALHAVEPTDGLVGDCDATVIAGRASAIRALLDHDRCHDVALVIVVGPPDETERSQLVDLCRCEVVYAFAPAGVRALWSERRGFPGLVTSPDADLVEFVDGEVVWSSLGWAGTVVLRLRTGLRATERALDSGTGGVAVTLCNPVTEAA